MKIEKSQIVGILILIALILAFVLVRTYLLDSVP